MSHAVGQQSDRTIAGAAELRLTRLRGARQGLAFGVALVAFLTASVFLQVARDRYRLANPTARYLYLPSGRLLEKLALTYDTLLADVYWIRAIQHYGGTKRSTDPQKKYDLLYPLLDIVTTLDPRFSIAYRFGAIFLAEAYPNGPGRPDLAVALLKKGIRAQPTKWQYRQDIGFVYYWWLNDYESAAAWFTRASEVPGSPWWLRSLAATTLAQGGERQASRLLWEQLRQTADHDWLRREGERRLAQLAALDELDQLRSVVHDFACRRGAWPASWVDLVRGGYLQQAPVDPAGAPYLLDPRTGVVILSPQSPLVPLPTEPPPLPSPKP